MKAVRKFKYSRLGEKLSLINEFTVSLLLLQMSLKLCAKSVKNCLICAAAGNKKQQREVFSSLEVCLFLQMRDASCHCAAF